VTAPGDPTPGRGPAPRPAPRTARGPTRRLFFALWPDADTRAGLAAATRKAVRRSGGRPVPPDNFHVTLAFLGNQPAALFEDIVLAGAAVPERPLELVLDRFGYFDRPRVFWLGAGGATAELARLAVEIWDHVEPLGIARDTRAFKAHLTLARKVARLPEVPPPAPVVWRASGFSLIESVTAQEGARYRVARTFPH